MSIPSPGYDSVKYADGCSGERRALARLRRRMSLSLRSIPTVTAAALGVITVAAWLALIAGTPMGDPATFLVAWVVMMAAMMIPSSAPMFLLYRLSANDAPNGGLRTILFGAGYLLVWAAVGMVVLVAQRVLDAVVSAELRPFGVAAVLLAAGAYQFTPLKATCLRACQTPADFLVRHWRTGAAGALRLGLDHGLYCLGCCWALMAVLVSAGGMGLAWVALIAVIVLIEKLIPQATWFSRAVGVAFAVGALVVLLRPELVTSMEM
jgi:predicted metal-binding membrane protein